MARIVYGGFLHETNTFAPDLADWAAFEAGGGWPALSIKDEIWPRLQGSNIPAAGFVEQALAAGDELIPTIWCAASPSAHVEQQTFERIVQILLESIEAALPVDAVYLDLHGAMVAQHCDDGEGEVLRRVRQLVGPDIPIAASLDLHANVTRKMLEEADLLVAYRTYPHIDMAQTGARTYALLKQKMQTGQPNFVAMQRLPFLIPICWQCTDIEPARSLYALLEGLEQDNVHMSFATGFPAADFSECAPMIWAYSDSYDKAQAAVQKLAIAALQAESQFAGKLYSADEAVQYAMQRAQTAQHPIVIADAQDNPGAGSNSDTTGLLRALVAHNAQDAAIGLIVDPEAARTAYEAGEGATLRLAIGGKSGISGDEPFEAEFLVEAVSTGKAEAKGPYYSGFTLDMGLSACLRIGGVRVVLASNKAQLADRVMFSYVGIDALRQKILVVKSAVHFRADFTPIAQEIIVAAAPGAMPMILSQLPWKNLPADIRV